MPEKVHRCVQHLVAKGMSEQQAWATCQANALSMGDDAGPLQFDALLLEAASIRVVEERKDGKGGIVQFPIAVATAKVIGEHTAAAAGGVYDLDRSFFEELIQNFPKRPGPVPIYFSHDWKLRNSRDGSMPLLASGNIRKVWLEGSALWGEADLGPQAWQAVVVERGFYGFSMENTFNEPIATGHVPGWALSAGIFTNSPALDVQFAASVGDQTTIRVTIPRRGGSGMRTVEELTAENAGLAKKILVFEAGQASEKTRADAAERALEAAKQASPAGAPERFQALEASNKELTERNKALEARVTEVDKKQLASEVLRVHAQAVADGVRPAFFAGVKEDPIKFLAANGGTIEALEGIVARLERVPFGRRNVQSGAEGDSGSLAEGPEEEVRLEATRIAAEKSINFGQALDVVRATKPEMWQRAMAAREARRQLSIAATRQ